MTEHQTDQSGPLPLLRPDEAARLLGKSRTWLYEALAAGMIEYVIIGGSRRIPQDALVTYVGRLRTEQSAAV